MNDQEFAQRLLSNLLPSERMVSVIRSDVETVESLSDAAVRAGAYETAVKGYALALRLRSETGFHPLRRAGDE